MGFRVSEREEKTMRFERLIALLHQSTELLQGLGQYVPDRDENRKVMEEAISSNTEVIRQEVDALHLEESRIITRL